MHSLLSLLKFSLLLRVSRCYNLETSHPIIYDVPEDSERASYFGLSVAIRPKAASLGDSWAIQVGAPRGSVEGSDAGRPGAVYRCHAFGPCRLFSADGDLPSRGGSGNFEFEEKKDGAWIGVSMDIVGLDDRETSVVCGHRWMNRNVKNSENIDVTYLMTGACYVQDLFNGTSEAPIERLLPLLDKDKIYTPKPYVVDSSTYHWGLGQAGMSVALRRGSVRLVLGAPGVTHWVGSVIRYDAARHVDVANFVKTDIPRRNRYTYLGYSVAAGRFYKDKLLWLATGAPRSANYRGQIFTFRFKLSRFIRESSDDVVIGSNFAGATFGEYFGSSLATLDLNGDGFDDLIVGAPLFSAKEPDEGRIYVYLSTERGHFLVPSQVINGDVARGRFGSCVTSIGDLDQDGYADVAVGAPYEDDGRGAVYVYGGSSKGARTAHSQRIRAQDIHPQLRGFGVSISAGADVDGNKYSDVAVGSYLSAHVVLLRSRPVVSLHPNVKTDSVGPIDRKDTYINVTLCARYAGSNAPDYVDIVRLVQVDPVYGRGTLDSKTSFRKRIRLRRNQILCEILSVFLNLSKKNYAPLQLVLNNELASCMNITRNSLVVKGEKKAEKDGFSKECPIGSKTEVSKEIPFAGICGADLVCRSDLELSCALNVRAESYAVGSSEPLVLSIDVRNLGEPAFGTKLKIRSNLKLNHLNGKLESSAESSKETFWFDIEPTLTEHFHIQKTGVTPLKDAEMTIHIPFYRDEEFLAFEIETPEWMQLSHVYSEKETLLGSEMKDQENPCPPSNRTLFLNCSTTENECKVLRIFFVNGVPTGLSSYVKLIISVNATIIDAIKQDKDIVYLSTAGILKFWKFLEANATLVQRSVSLSLYNEEHELHVDGHIVAMSVLAGGFLLSLIVTGLVKASFFKRAKKQELKALRDADESFVYFANSTDSCRE